MRFRDQVVFVRVNDAGKPALDSEGRAEMKYRETDSKSYRPAPKNLGAVTGTEKATAPAKTRTAKRARKATAPRKAAAAKAGKPRAGEVAVWTDGACTGNPGPMGIGMVVITPTTRLDRGDYLGQGTNNIAELVAIERGLEMVEELCPGTLDGSAAPPICVYSDSSYSIGILSKGWKAKANQALIARIRDRLAPLGDIRFEKVRGHAGVPLNERCDELAREAIRARGPVGS